MDSISYSPPNILVVDDVNANLAVLTEMIRKAGYIARPVTSAKQALNAIDALEPHLILLDISMPEMDGFVFCSLLKKNANTRDIPVIFITALDSTEDKIRGFQLGAVDYISKPFEVDEVTMRINTHLKMYKIQQELEVYNKKLYKIINDQIRKIYDGQKHLIEAMAKLYTINNPIKEAQIRRIGDNSRILAISLQLTPKFKEQITNSYIDVIELAALLHNIGDNGMSEALLLTTDPTEEELAIIQRHPAVGAEALEKVHALGDNNEFIRMAMDIAKYHHECFDGSGYPTGIMGTEIPLCARIVSVIDFYDSMVSIGYGGRALSHEEAVQKINQSSGTKFDPDIVTVFNKIQNQLKRI